MDQHARNQGRMRVQTERNAYSEQSHDGTDDISQARQKKSEQRVDVTSIHPKGDALDELELASGAIVAVSFTHG